MQEALRRSAAAAQDLKKGTVVLESDLIWVRPGVVLHGNIETICLEKVESRL